MQYIIEWKKQHQLRKKLTKKSNLKTFLRKKWFKK